jgi:hypothetical protein
MKFEQELIFERYSTHVLNEGGAAGHMMHPFDLPEVTTFNDLVRVFDDAVVKLERGTSTIKLDGVNLSLKIVNKPLSKFIPKQFALDRGSQKEIDVNGITIDDLESRFPPDPIRGIHGMVDKGRTILQIMNNSIRNIEHELKLLEMWDDPTKFLNSEYINGRENVVDYGDKKLIALHGVNQFYERFDRQGKLTRPGLKSDTKTLDTGKITSDKTVSRKINYNYEALEQLRVKVKPYADKFNFDVVTGIYVSKFGIPNFNIPLNKQFTVKFSKNEEITKPLKQWISNAKLPKNAKLKTLSGKVMFAISKDNYVNVLEHNTPLDELYEEQYIPDAVAGALTYHVTKELGNEILDNFTTDKYGKASTHEGIVLSDTLYGQDQYGNPNSIKITGEFILSGMGGAFSTIKPTVSPVRPSDEEDQSAPEVNHGGGKMNFSSYFSNPPK